MEFFNGNLVTENGLSLADMMESDLKSEFSEDILGGTNFEISTSLSDFNFLQNGLSLANTSMEAEKATNLGDLSWLHNAVSSPRDILQPENNDPNLLVNPQTGLPITQQQPTVVSVANSGSNIVKLEGGLGSPVQQQQQENRVQFVNNIQGLSSPARPTTIAQTQTFIQQNGLNSPVQAIHSPSHQTIQTQRPGVINLNNYQQQAITTQLLANSAKKNLSATAYEEAKSYPKPVYSYSCLIAMALKNSDTGALPVSEIYSFMTENFPYFKTAPDGWKNSVRHNLSLNKCFEKIENPKANGNTRKGCLWGLNPLKIEKMDEEIAKWRKKDPVAIRKSMSKPDTLESLEKGNIGSHSPRHPNNIIGNCCPTLPNGHLATTINVTATTITAPQGTPSPPPQNEIQMTQIEIKPSSGQGGVYVKNEPVDVKMEDLTDGDLNILDNSMTLDPALSDTLLQNGIWDELSTEGINLDELTSGTFNVSFNSLTTSPATVPTSVLSSNNTNSPLISLLTSNGAAAVVNGNQYVRTISAHT